MKGVHRGCAEPRTDLDAGGVEALGLPTMRFEIRITAIIH
jgi:hypothetical protein